MRDKSNEKGEQTPNLAKRKLNEMNVELDQKRIKMDSSQVAVPKRGEGVVCSPPLNEKTFKMFLHP